jgi:glycosyltransferase involved in cell wall biosynthesis
MRPAWESGWRGRLYALGRRLTPLSWRRAIRRRVETERLLGLRKPPVDLPALPAEPGAARPGRPDVVVLPVIAWTYRRQRPQQLSEALARRGRRVFYGSVAGTGEPETPAAAAPGVTLLPISGVRHQDLPERRLEAAALEAALSGIARARERFAVTEAVVLAESPFWAPLASALSTRFGWKVAYDCLDVHEGFRANRPRVLAEAERDLISAADLVLATSEPLRLRLSAGGLECRLLPNACDYDLFAGLPPPSPSAQRLVVGYAGAVDEWFDMELLDRLAQLQPRWRFEIAGGLGDSSAPIRRSNVVFHGELPHRDMPAFRSRLDVEIIPFRLSELTNATDPVKLYEAAAAGRMVVATPMASLEPFVRLGVARSAATAEDFAREIAAAAAGAVQSAPNQRAFARENTWDVRAATLDGWLAALPRRAAAAR